MFSKKYFILLLVQLSFAASYAQHNYDYYKNLPVDSLEQIVKNWKGEDTLLARLNNALSSKLAYRDNDKSKFFAEKALKISQKLNFYPGLSVANNNLGLLYGHEDNLEKGLSYLNKAVTYYALGKDTGGMATGYANLGVIYAKSNQYDLAITNFQKSIHYWRIGKPHNSPITVALNLAFCYKLLGKYDDCINECKKIIEDPQCNVNEKVRALGGIGDSYVQVGKLDSAFKYLTLAENLESQVEEKYSLLDVKTGLANYFLKKNDYPTAISYLKYVYRLTKDEGNIDEQASAAIQLAELFEKTNDYKQAAFYFKDYGMLRDSLNKIANTAALKKVENDFELKRQDDKLKLLEQEQALSSERLWRSRALAILAFLIIGVLLLLGIGIYKRSRLKMRIADEKVKSTETQLRLQAVESYLNGQLLERKRLAQDLHDGLGATLAGIKLKALGIAINNQDKENMNELIGEINLVCEEVRNISHNLIPPEFENCSFANLIEQFMKNQKRCHPEIAFDFSVNEEGRLEKLSLLQKISAYRILQEAVNNAVKHSSAKSINILITPFENYISFVVEDDGNGFDVQKIHDGIGLHNMRDRAKEIHTELNIDATPGMGTVVAFELPLNNQ